MKAIDTNVLVRFLVCDDADMPERARHIFEQARDKSEPLLIPTLVLLETLWVLRSSYAFSRDTIIESVKQLLILPAVTFESYGLVRAFIHEATAANTELADILIGLQAQSAGAETLPRLFVCHRPQASKRACPLHCCRLHPARPRRKGLFRRRHLRVPRIGGAAMRRHGPPRP